ncbi:MAG: hypothetical protein M3680_09675, partial [Myxococcota bacterium]|nr:hypothetical protein [Myxococcota bacterium]
MSAGSLVVAALFAAIALGGLLLPAAYARETENWALQATAQDWFDLVIAAPGLAIAALRAARGSRRAQLVLAGALLFTVYTLVIYTFAIHLNALFLLYCAALGVALYTLIALGGELAPSAAPAAPVVATPRRLAGGFLVTVGVAFGMLWLLQLVPAALEGREPPELVQTGLFTNPIHVIDLSFILPLHILAGVMLWRGRALGWVLGPVVLAFDVLMAGSIGFLVVMVEQATPGAGYGVAIAMGAVALISLGLLIALLRSPRTAAPQA